MILHLYSTSPPSGRCILLVRALYDATGQTQSSFQVAEELFWFMHKPENPVQVTVTKLDAVNALRKICHEVGITVEEAG